MTASAGQVRRSVIVSMANDIAVVFGAFGGIGQACVQEFLEKGYKLLVCDLLLDDDVISKWISTFGSENVEPFICDVTKTENVEGAFSFCGSSYGSRPSLVINCAGIIDEFKWEQCVDINLNGSIRIVLSTLNHLGKHRGGNGGSLLIISSVLGLERGPNVPVYTATKHGIVGLVRSWAAPLHHEDHGVSISCLCPTAVDTPLLVNSAQGKIYKPEALVAINATRGDEQSFLRPKELAEKIVEIMMDQSNNGRVFCMSRTEGCREVQFEDRPCF